MGRMTSEQCAVFSLGHDHTHEVMPDLIEYICLRLLAPSFHRVCRLGDIGLHRNSSIAGSSQRSERSGQRND